MKLILNILSVCILTVAYGQVNTKEKMSYRKLLYSTTTNSTDWYMCVSNEDRIINLDKDTIILHKVQEGDSQIAWHYCYGTRLVWLFSSIDDIEIYSHHHEKMKYKFKVYYDKKAKTNMLTLDSDKTLRSYSIVKINTDRNKQNIEITLVKTTSR